jgi:hypothetical protein
MRASEKSKALSPQAWGWTGGLLVNLIACQVVPTGVGVDRIMKKYT